MFQTHQDDEERQKKRLKLYPADCNEGVSYRTFQLLRSRGLSATANEGCIGLHDVIKGDVTWAIISNYMMDVEWMCNACPSLSRIQKVILMHGESGPNLINLQMTCPPNFELYKPPVPDQYGTHHSKFLVLVYARGVRVVVHTANMISGDWNNKTQGLWMQDFPLKPTATGPPSPFENNFVEYMAATKWRNCRVPDGWGGEEVADAQFFQRFDFSGANVELVASVPGYHTQGSLEKWGHLRLRKLLRQASFALEFSNAPVVYQCSSMGSLTAKWLHEEFGKSTSAGNVAGSSRPLGPPSSVRFVWPTVDDVRNSTEGYAAGASIPGTAKNVQKDFLRPLFARWSARVSGRMRAMPHIKTYLRHRDQSIAWFLLTSSNLSKAAWGALQKNETQLFIRSFELGVLFLPSKLAVSAHTTPFSLDPDPPRPTPFPPRPIPGPSQATGPEASESQTAVILITREWTAGARGDDPRGQEERGKEGGEANERVASSLIVRVPLPIPYSLPPPLYESNDLPWACDNVYKEPDIMGTTWPRHINKHSH